MLGERPSQRDRRARTYKERHWPLLGQASDYPEDGLEPLRAALGRLQHALWLAGASGW